VLFQHFLPLTGGRVPYQTSFVAQIRPVFKFFALCLQNPRDALISKQKKKKLFAYQLDRRRHDEAIRRGYHCFEFVSQNELQPISPDA